VLYMSGYTDDTVIRAGGYDAGRAFIQKPFGGAEIARYIRELLGAGTEPTETSSHRRG
jgi:hypothetical protein